MPHSSGGGSAGGGSHGGSYSSSSDGASSHPISSKPYVNAKRYVYETRNGEKHYVYSNIYPQKVSIGTFIGQMFFLLPFVGTAIMFILILIWQNVPPKPLMCSNPGGPYVEDRISVLDNTAQLTDALSSFEALTGITPYIVTVKHSDWIGTYSKLTDYAYDLYLELFHDEKHFLLVYSEPDNIDNRDSYFEWMWEGMQGNDTDSIISSSKFTIFRETLQNGLVSNHAQPGRAMYTAFADTGDYIMENTADFSDNLIMIIVALFWDSMTILALTVIIKNFVRSRHTFTEAPEYNLSQS